MINAWLEPFDEDYICDCDKCTEEPDFFLDQSLENDWEECLHEYEMRIYNQKGE